MNKQTQNDQGSQFPSFSSYGNTENAKYLRKLMKLNYTVKNLKNITPVQFKSYITSLPGRRDAEIEGYIDISHQRDLSVQFEWGHNHDFGSFFMPGMMGDRHVNILATFMTEYGIPKQDMSDKTVLDIGCWTGGTSLLLAAMGAQVYAIEEVCNYVDCVNYIKNAFAIDNLQIESRSLFSLDSHEFIDRFDIVLYSGVIYHVSDPILSLRIVFNSLKDGGLCLLETRGIEGKRKYLAYGERIQRENRKSLVSSTLLGGWAWFIPSLESLIAMMKDVGFQVHKATFHNGNRILAIGLRNQHVDMLRAGLSKPNIR